MTIAIMDIGRPPVPIPVTDPIEFSADLIYKIKILTSVVSG
jgi:hypothetical protein